MSIILRALQQAERERWCFLEPEGSAAVFWAPALRGGRMKAGTVVLFSLFLGTGAGLWFAKAPGEMAFEKPKQEVREAASPAFEAAIPKILSGLTVSSLPGFQESPPPTPAQTTMPEEVPEEKAAPPEAPRAGQAASGPPSDVRDAPPPPVPAEPTPAVPAPLLTTAPAAGPPAAGEEFGFKPAPAPAAASSSLPAEPERKENWTPQDRIEAAVGEQKRVPPAPGRTPASGNPIAEAWEESGKLAEQEGRLDEAIAHFLKVVRMRSDHAPAHEALGRLYAKRGDHILAINEFHLAARNAPADPEPLYAVSVLYARLGSTSFAREHLEKAISRDAGIRERALRDPAFSGFLRSSEFQALLGFSGEKKIGP